MSLRVIARRRVKPGAEQGGELVRQEFARHITRSSSCEEVGISQTTLKKWERLGMVKPEFVDILKSKTAVFDEEDVARGKKIAALMAEHHGTMSLAQAAALVSE